MSVGTSASSVTSPNILFYPNTTTARTPSTTKEFPIGGIIGIVIGSVLLIGTVIKIVQLLRTHLTKPPPSNVPPDDKDSLTAPVQQYRVATRTNPYTASTNNGTSMFNEQTQSSNQWNSSSDGITQHLIEIEC